MVPRFAAPVLTLCLTGTASAFWRLMYPVTDWAALALMLLSVPVWLGNWRIGLDLRRARLSVALRPGTWITSWLTGRLATFFSASVFTILFLLLAAPQILDASPVELVAYAALMSLAAFAAGLLRLILSRALLPPFAAGWSVSATTLLCGFLFTPLLFYIAWALKSFPGEIRAAPTILDAMLAGIQAGPGRGGWIAELLGYFRAADAARLWLATREAWSGWATVLFAAHGALFSLVLARSAAFLALWIEDKTGPEI